MSKILSYEQKARVLKENGWETWYHYDNWIKTEWYTQCKKIDMMGISTDSAYKSYLYESKLIRRKKEGLSKDEKAFLDRFKQNKDE